jgi:glycosyltransferase involved in cell wall biosynthesis
MGESSKKKILFICHEGSRTGAPLLLLRMIKEVVKLGIFQVKIIVMSDGVLVDEMRQIADTYLLNYPGRGSYSVKERVYLKMGLTRLTREAKYNERISLLFANADIVFANTIISILAVERFNLSGKRLLFFLHELAFAVKALVTDKQLEYIRRNADVVFVPAEFVRKFYIENLGFAPEKVKLLKYIIPAAELSEKANTRGEEKFVVGCCGSLEARKGADIFLQIVYYIVHKRKLQNMHFVWVGAKKSSLEYLLFSEDVRKTNLQDYITVIPSIADPMSEVSRFDIFALTSREDPYPVAVLEAASVAVPTVYFKNAGGISEFLKGGGIGVDYLNTAQMGDEIISLATDRVKLRELKENVFRSFTIEPDAKAIMTIFLNTLDQREVLKPQQN